MALPTISLCSSSISASARPSPPSPPMLSSDDAVWIPTLQKLLPGSWTDTSTADRAVKADGARVDFFPWHQRVRLVLPSSEQVLEVFERLGMRRWRKNIVRSFFSYLSSTYGRNWRSRVFPSGFRSRESGPSLTCRPRQHQSGMATKGGTTQAKNHTGSLDELVQDLKQGLRVLGQVLQSTSHGSSLFFWRWNGEEQIRAARDGMRIYVLGPLPV